MNWDNILLTAVFEMFKSGLIVLAFCFGKFYIEYQQKQGFKNVIDCLAYGAYCLGGAAIIALMASHKLNDQYLIIVSTYTLPMWIGLWWGYKKESRTATLKKD